MEIPRCAHGHGPMTHHNHSFTAAGLPATLSYWHCPACVPGESEFQDQPGSGCRLPRRELEVEELSYWFRSQEAEFRAALNAAVNAICRLNPMLVQHRIQEQLVRLARQAVEVES